MMKAASSGEPAFTGARSPAPALTAAVPLSEPKPPSSTLMIERFIPLHMM